MKGFKHNIKLILALLWLNFAASMVAWWWINGLEELRRYSTVDPETLRKMRMIRWEGSVFLAAIFIGGIALIFLLYRDKIRHEQMRLFFSNFNHDLKTSMARIRLQMDLLREEQKGSPALNRLADDVSRLNLQLENSLLLSAHSGDRIFRENLKLSDILREIRPECEDLEIKVRNDVKIRGDRRILTSLFRNLIQNSLTHGRSTTVEIESQPRGADRVELVFRDNGVGFQGDSNQLESLGHSLQSSTSKRGFGLFVSRNLLRRMNADMSFRQPVRGFEVRLQLSGEIL